MTRREEAGAGGIAQAHDLALDRTDRHARVRGEAVERFDPCAGGNHHLAGGDELAVRRLHARHPLTGDDDARDLGALAQHPARALDRDGERGAQRARIDRVVAGDVERQPQRRRERRLAATRLAREQPLDRQSERLALGSRALQRLGLVAIARDEQRAARAVAGIALGRLGQLLDEGVVAVERGAAEREQPALADARLADRREHAGGDARGPAREHVALQHDRPQAALLRAPRDGEAGDSAAHDGDVEAIGGVGHVLLPCAGMTRIRF